MKGAVSELIDQQLLALRLRNKLWDSLAACGVSDWAHLRNAGEDDDQQRTAGVLAAVSYSNGGRRRHMDLSERQPARACR